MKSVFCFYFRVFYFLFQSRVEERKKVTSAEMKLSHLSSFFEEKKSVRVLCKFSAGRVSGAWMRSNAKIGKCGD